MWHLLATASGSSPLAATARSRCGIRLDARSSARSTLDTGPATASLQKGVVRSPGHRDGSVSLWDLETGDKLASYKRSDARYSGRVHGERRIALRHRATIGPYALFDARSAVSAVQVLEGHDSAVRGPRLLPGEPAFWRLAPPIGPSNSGTRPPTSARPHLPGSQRCRDSRSANARRPRARFGQSRRCRPPVVDHVRPNAPSSCAGHRGRVTALAFSPDGQTAGLGSEDGTVRAVGVPARRRPRNCTALRTDVRGLSFRRTAAALHRPAATVSCDYGRWAPSSLDHNPAGPTTGGDSCVEPIAASFRLRRRRSPTEARSISQGQRRVLDCMIDQGVDGICILANYSEQFLLTDEERNTLLELCLVARGWTRPRDRHVQPFQHADRRRASQARSQSRRQDAHADAALSRRDATGERYGQ